MKRASNPMDAVVTTEAPLVTGVPRRSRWARVPIVSHLRQSVGLQRGMLIAGLVLTAIFLLTALFAPLLSPYGFSQLRDENGAFGAQHHPSKAHLLGTTQGGMDVLSRLIWGSRTALYVIVVAVIASIIVGVFLGLISGYFGGWLDRVMIVIADAVYSFPSLLLAIVLAIVISGGQSSMWGGIFAAALSITVVFIPQYLRVTRAEVIRIKSEAFVESARVIGASNFRIMTRHVLRNSTRTLPLILTLNASEAILTLAGLGFLGFGIEPTKAAEWGYDLNKSLSDVTSGIWWTSVFPGAAIVLVVLGLTLVGESLNDLADPRLRKRAAGPEPVEDLGVGLPAVDLSAVDRMADASDNTSAVGAHQAADTNAMMPGVPSANPQPTPAPTPTEEERP